MINLSTLKELALKAGQDEWDYSAWTEDRYYGAQEEADCDFITACNPQAILALIARIEKMEEALKWILSHTEDRTKSDLAGMTLDYVAQTIAHKAREALKE